MSPEFAEQEYFVLHLLSVSAEPLGAGTIKEELARNGMDMSEASVGRFIRDLDNRGITERVGFQGRVLTPLGEERLGELVSEREKIVSTGAFLEAVKSREKDMLLEILVARRAIERELAALAAESRSEKDIAVLREILNRQNDLISRGEPMASTDPEFHREVARISGNKVLQSAIEIIRKSGEGASFFEYIRTRVGSRVGSDHEPVFRAIEAGDPDAAAAAMALHIDNIIRDVRTYWKDHMRELARPGGGP
ncbi:MAG TPA: FCD domain-containing protein [Synergistales bacterium]|jgi:GntR family L-lactate dehydrogenase operon transcriptional regulator|nr:FCD domain-containing protein [Synergistales bacterium]HRV71584.1 FCD domain-containing protein [Thermovirgaceae bacterium]